MPERLYQWPPRATHPSYNERAAKAVETSATMLQALRKVEGKSEAQVAQAGLMTVDELRKSESGARPLQSWESIRIGRLLKAEPDSLEERPTFEKLAKRLEGIY